MELAGGNPALVSSHWSNQFAVWLFSNIDIMVYRQPEQKALRLWGTSHPGQHMCYRHQGHLCERRHASLINTSWPVRPFVRAFGLHDVAMSPRTQWTELKGGCTSNTISLNVGEEQSAVYAPPSVSMCGTCIRELGSRASQNVQWVLILNGRRTSYITSCLRNHTAENHGDTSMHSLYRQPYQVLDRHGPRAIRKGKFN